MIRACLAAVVTVIVMAAILSDGFNRVAVVPESYSVSRDGYVLTLVIPQGVGDEIISSRIVIEDESSVTVAFVYRRVRCGFRLMIELYIPVMLTLDSPLGDREVRDSSGVIIPYHLP